MSRGRRGFSSCGRTVPRLAGIFAIELAAAWREYLDRKGTKPSTLVGYDAMLAEPGTAPKRGERARVGYMMAALGDLAAAEVTVGNVEALLATIAATGASPRTVEKHRIMVRGILNYGIRETKRATAGSGSSHGHDYGLTANAAQVAEGPRKQARGVLVYYLPKEVEALARALEHGAHRHSAPQHQPTCSARTGGQCDCRPEYRVGRLTFGDVRVRRAICASIATRARCAQTSRMPSP